MNKERISENIQCSCGQHLLLVTHDIDSNMDVLGQEYVTEEFFLSMFTFGYGGNKKPTLKWRLKTAWKVLIYGTQHEDSVCMTADETVKLKNFLELRLKKLQR